jgi:adenylyl- and sulfurtransferase ThiI
LQPPEFAPNKVLINLQNGTFEVTTERQELRPFNSADIQKYAGYLFIRHGSGLKFEKCLILYGNGANE